ncbi:hypothetical protein JOD63_002081 [Microbacterium terrae]|uniref:Uncharacterized protein n=1 Tax=Microbacterium terrae TaxID=69369 RepID=A0A0M2H656_9MICO|nr:hypothetical protein [Microbacterium terrae]KJL39521.1 hypothetical protein RS81_01938 [Microbacterium terrae]MBP1078113.1 hypothetical protein [Microbacterium terrae]GLK00285.1 hypothetical protein GCM10017594_34830 [Microbacterium terrae]
MSDTPTAATPATAYARSARAWTPLDWWKLEARALHGVPEVRRALAFFAPSEAWKDLAKNVAPAWGCLLTLSHIASFTLPVVALLFLLPWAFGSVSQASVGVSGILAGIAAIIAGNGIVTEFRESLGTDPRIHRMLGALHLIPSAIGSVLAASAIAQGVADGAWGIAGFVADVVVGVLHFVLFRGAAHTGTDRWKRNIAQLERAVDGMPPAERARIYADVQGALVVLSERGLVSASDVARAQEVRLGLLGITMAPREDLTPR